MRSPQAHQTTDHATPDITDLSVSDALQLVRQHGQCEVSVRKAGTFRATLAADQDGTLSLQSVPGEAA